MRTIAIRKRSGGWRTIYVPSYDEATALRRLLPAIDGILDREIAVNVVHGFRRHRSAVSNAMNHFDRACTTCLDLSDFFDTVTRGMLSRWLSPDVLDMVCVDGAARQGLPTSPSCANLAATPMDRAILAWIGNRNVTYTRYADDLSLSYDDPAMTDEIVTTVCRLATQAGFAVNQKKTRTMAASAGRRAITGVAVDLDGVHPTRRAKRRLRAALHQGRTEVADGLAEWCKVKMPRRPMPTLRGEGKATKALERL